MTKIWFLTNTLLIISLSLFGCSNSSITEVKSTKMQEDYNGLTPEQKEIIDEGTKLAKNLNLKPFIFKEDLGSGGGAIFRSEIFSNDDLFVNASSGNVFVGQTLIKQGQFARKNGSNFEVVK